MSVRFHNGSVLFTGNSVAMHADCCCDDEVCECPSNLDDVYRIVAGCTSWFPGDACEGESTWSFTVEREAEGTVDTIDPPDSTSWSPAARGVPGCWWWGEVDGGFGHGKCGEVFLYLRASDCVWVIVPADSGGMGQLFNTSEPGAGENEDGPEGEYPHYWFGGNVIVESLGI